MLNNLLNNFPCFHSTRLNAAAGIRHVFSGRQGGVSDGEFSTLNCSPFSGDRAADIYRNRNIVATSLAAERLVSLRQVHGCTVHCVDQSAADAWDDNNPPSGDGLVTATAQVAIGVLGADCAPVLFADKYNRVVGAAHGGWAGAVNGVTDAVLDAMCAQGAQRSKIIAAIGPAIQRKSYVVGLDFKQRVFDCSAFSCAEFFSPAAAADKCHFDLPAYLQQRIHHAGIDEVDRLSQDTYAEPQQLFSYRRSSQHGEVEYGRQMGVIMLVP